LQSTCTHKHLHFTDSVHTFFYTAGHGFNAIKNPPEESQHKTSTIAFKHTENVSWHKTYIQNQQSYLTTKPLPIMLMFLSYEKHPDVRNSDISVRQDKVRRTADL